MRQCAFCPCTASLTGEHLRSDWVNKLLEGRTHHYVISQRSYGGKPTQWRNKQFNLKANVVCADCNSGWMSQVDNEAKLTLQDIILRDSPVCILPQGLSAIAAFTMKSAFVADYLTRHRAPFFDHSTRQAFARSRIPTEGAHMWLGRIRQPRGKKSGIYKTRYGTPRDKVLQRLIITCSLSALRRFCFSLRLRDSLIASGTPHTLLNSTKRKDSTVCLSRFGRPESSASVSNGPHLRT